MMDQQELRRLENLCIQEWAPWCTATCPVHVDVRAMTAAISAGDFKTAAQVLQRTVPFAGIISRICDHPCEDVCRRRDAGEAISIRLLEQVVMSQASAVAARPMPMPKKDKRVAVVGAGLSGLTVAFDLAKKGYQVALFEADNRLGGSLWAYTEDELPRPIILKDFEVLESLSAEMHLNSHVGRDVSFSELERDYSAIYLGTGREAKSPLTPDSDGIVPITVDKVTFQTSTVGVFAGGSAISARENRSPIRSISDGRRAAISIDRFLQKVSLTASREREGAYETRLFTSIEGIEPLPRVRATNPIQGYSSDEGIAEAKRCLQCECMECVKICEFLENFKGYPKKYVRQIYNNLSIVMGHRHGNKFINSCSLCGLCKEVCPESLHMGEVCKAARGTMVSQGKMPPSAHEFALRDMEFSNSDEVALFRHQPGAASSTYLFFPGCQLTGSSPSHVISSYKYLTERLQGGVGLMLRCCGAPADWAGRTETVSQLLDEFRTQWIEMGQPQLILACSSCYSVFKAYLPDIPLVSLWEVFDRSGLPAAEAERPSHTALAIHDPCTSRHEPQIHKSVRNIAKDLGFQIMELPLSRDRTECCGFGGLMYFANRELADRVIRRRIDQSKMDLLAYCAVCRDHFSSRGRRTWHLLDLIFGHGGEPAGSIIDYSQRRENRVRLRRSLLRELWSDKDMEGQERQGVKLRIPDAVRELMEQRMILVEDLQQVIEWAESSGNKLVHRESGHSLAHFRPGNVTYWVEYSPDKDGFTIHNCYSHRMEIIEELKR